MRRGVKNRIHPGPDMTYQSERVGKFINTIMWDGKREIAERIVYKAFEVVREKLSTDPLEVFEAAIRNAGPVAEVRSRRIGGANYQVPREVRPERRQALAMRWIKEEARSKKGVPMHQKLADEIIAASKNEGNAVKRKENTHKMAEANKAFSHFSW